MTESYTLIETSIEAFSHFFEIAKAKSYIFPLSADILDLLLLFLFYIQLKF